MGGYAREGRVGRTQGAGADETTGASAVTVRGPAAGHRNGPDGRPVIFTAEPGSVQGDVLGPAGRAAAHREGARCGTRRGPQSPAPTPGTRPAPATGRRRCSTRRQTGHSRYVPGPQTRCTPAKPRIRRGGPALAVVNGIATHGTIRHGWDTAGQRRTDPAAGKQHHWTAGRELRRDRRDDIAETPVSPHVLRTSWSA